jgi:hypothetical protein
MVEGRKEFARWARDIILTDLLLPTFKFVLCMTPPQVIVVWLCALALVKAWEHGKFAITVAALLAAGAALEWDWYYFNTFLVPRTLQAQTSAQKPVPPAGQTVTPQAPQPPPPPWASDGEIEQQKKAGRTLLIRSPQELLNLWENGRDLTIFQHKWIKVDYPAVGPPVSKTMGKKEYYVVTVRFQADRFFTMGALDAHFDPKKYGDQLLRVDKGDRVYAVCEFETIEHKDGNPYAVDTIIGYDCDLL